MKTIPISSILIPPSRQRSDRDKRHEDHIGNLLESIFSLGLINPITLRDGNTLIAGECRLEAITLGYKVGKTLYHMGQPVPAGEIPFLDFGELSPLNQMEVEYAENARRLDLSWQENARAVAALDALRKAHAEAKGEKHTQVETAAELKTSPFSVSTKVMVSKHLDDPAVAKAATLNEALKVIKKKVDAEQREKLAGEVGKTLATDRMQVYHADCLGWMKEQPDGLFDVVLTDPPYGMDADTFGDAAGRLAGTTHEYQDDAAGTMALLAAAIPEFYRLAKPEAHLYLWCDIDLFPWLRAQAAAAGWWVHRTPLINIKREGGRVPWPSHGPRRSYELCLYAVKGKKPVTSIRSDVFESTLTEGNFGHGAQKPVEAYVELLKRSVKPGDRVFDAFAGTGTIFPAAAAVGCYAVGVEQEAAAFGTCVRRIGELK